jgi:hypothetical protein
MIESDYGSPDLSPEAQAVANKMFGILSSKPFGTGLLIGYSLFLLMPLPDQKFEMSAISFVNAGKINSQNMPPLYLMDHFITDDLDSDCLVELQSFLIEPKTAPIPHWKQWFVDYYSELGLAESFINEFNEFVTCESTLKSFRDRFVV